MVIDELNHAEAYKLARHYSEYRLLHEQKRKMNTTDGKILSLLERNNEEAKQENANKNPIINSTLRDYMAGTRIEVMPLSISKCSGALYLLLLS